jgi:hypothetical protein
MMASWGILKKSGARLAIRLRNEKIAKDIGSIDDPASRRAGMTAKPPNLRGDRYVVNGVMLWGYAYSLGQPLPRLVDNPACRQKRCWNPANGPLEQKQAS